MSRPSEFSVRLQHGITGGFAPPQPSAIHTLTASPQLPQTLLVHSLITSDPASASAEPKKLTINDDHEKLVQELHGILKEIPTESPPGSEDIYGMDTSIAWGSNDLEWSNGAPGGCGQGTSSVQPTEKDKVKFKRAVEIVTQLSKS